MIRSSRNIRIPVQFTHYGLHMLIGGREAAQAPTGPSEKNKTEQREYMRDEDDALSSNRMPARELLAGVK